ncbi:MAG: hypothetical protein IJJ76_12395 [Ruminococcus sp.]|uniref:hypothetical protein n=1 Tax=Ruminococcus sp. TaxID=41978 RepID=UPI0025DAD107|nr:hypothetical protein [Ruminococcus sp.]MBR0530546.1 hypothetical protein [Ruminococcus sp.]
MDSMRFDEALKKMTAERPRQGIGTLGEKTVHAVLKEYYGGGDESKEIKVGGFVADCVCEDGVVEIQTRQLYRLDRKLAALLPVCRVTVVFPVEREKTIITVDEDSGELISRRRSPKHVTVYHAIARLYGIRQHLADDNLTVRLPVLSVEEFRSANKKRGRTAKLDRVPTAMSDEIVLTRPEDYAALFTPLPDVFTSAELAKLCHIDRDSARQVIGVLKQLQLVTESGRRGRSKLFSLV